MVTVSQVSVWECLRPLYVPRSAATAKHHKRNRDTLRDTSVFTCESEAIWWQFERKEKKVLSSGTLYILSSEPLSFFKPHTHYSLPPLGLADRRSTLTLNHTRKHSHKYTPFTHLETAGRCSNTHTHTRLFLWIVGTFHRLLLLLYWPNNIFYPLTQP